MSVVVSAFLVTWIALLLLGLALAGVVRQLRLLSNQTPTGLPPSPAPTRAVHLPGLARGFPQAVLLVDQSCGVCQDRLMDLAAQVDSHADAVSVAVATRDGEPVEQSTRFGAVEDPVALFDRVDPPYLPYGIVVAGDGRVTFAGPMGSAAHVGQLVQTAVDLAMGERYAAQA